MVLPTPAGTFTSNSGTPGLSDNLVQTSYDLAIREGLNISPTFRQFVTVRPERQPHQGDAIVLQRFNFHSEATITASKTPLTEEADVNAVKMPATTPVTLTPAEYGGVVTHTRYLSNRVLAPFDSFKAKSIVDWSAKTIDEIIQDRLKAGIVETTIDGTAENTLTSVDVLTAQRVRDTVVGFQENGVPTWSGEFYVAVVHPRVAADLRAAAGSGNWRVGKEYMNDPVLERLATEVGQFEGVRFVVNARTRKGLGSATGAPGGGQAATYNSYFFGQGGLAEAVVEEPSVVVGPEVDNLRRFVTLGWKVDADWGVFEPKAISITISSSALG